MASKVSEWSTSQSSNGEIGGTNIAEGCSPAGINNAIRTVMSQIATARTGSDDGLITGTAGAAGNVGVFDANGDLIDGGVAPGGVADNAVTTVKLANDAVTRVKIDDAAMSGDDALLITGTPGASGVLAQWNADGDLVSSVSIVTESSGISGNDNDTTVPTSAASKDYTDTAVATAIAGVETGGRTLLGTITLSGTSQSLSGLDLTGYTHLRLDLRGITTTLSSGAISVAGVDVASSVANSSLYTGFVEIELSAGHLTSIVAAEGGGASFVISADTALSTASTSIDVATDTGTFDDGTVPVWGIA